MTRSKDQKRTAKLSQAKKSTPHFEPAVSLKVLRSLHNAAANNSSADTSPQKEQLSIDQHPPSMNKKTKVASSLLNRIRDIKKGGGQQEPAEGDARQSTSAAQFSPTKGSPPPKGKPTGMAPLAQKETQAVGNKASSTKALKDLPLGRRGKQKGKQQQRQHQQRHRKPQKSLVKTALAIPLPRSKASANAAVARPLPLFLNEEEDQEDESDRLSVGRQSCSSLRSEELSTPMRTQLSDLRRFVAACQQNPNEQAAVPFGQRTAAPSTVAPPPPHQAEAPSVFSLASLRDGLRSCGTMLAEGAARLSPRNTMGFFPSLARPHLGETPAPLSHCARSCVVMDTSSLLRADVAVLNLMVEKWTVCVPFAVLDELDNFIHNKKGSKEKKEQNANQAMTVRNWMSAQMKKKDDSIRFQKKSEVVQEYDVRNKNNDDSILGFAVYLREKSHRVLFITDDIILSLKAKAELGDSSTYTYSQLKTLLGLIH